MTRITNLRTLYFKLCTGFNPGSKVIVSDISTRNNMKHNVTDVSISFA